MSQRQRATFGAEELAVVLSHYDLGVIESVTEFSRGSHRSPKVGIVAERGKFLLKRRSIKRVNLDRAHFAHAVQTHLVATDFPTAKLIATQNHGRSLLRIRDHLYELYEFVGGHPFRIESDGPVGAKDAGAVLARFHQQVEGLEPASGVCQEIHRDYHDDSGVRTGLLSIGSTLSSHDSFSGDEAELATLVQALLATYDQAAEAVNRRGFGDWTQQLIHSDWHPGNILLKNSKVVAVIDLDGLRISRRIVDVANGALQFSMIAGGDPDTWPEHLDEERFHAFLSGYESNAPLSEQERAAVPELMIEALTSECVPPITETGSVGRWAGYRVLRMIQRKGNWLTSNGERLMQAYEP